MKSFNTLAFLTGAAALALLSACQQAETPAPESSATESNGPDAKPGISASQGRLVLPVVAGRPAAVYFSVRNDGPQAATIAGVYVEGSGKAEMHKTEGGSMSAVDAVEIAPGETIAFEPGGYHVMAFDLADTLKAGNATELTLTFSGGDKLSMPLHIETMGDAMNGGHH
ncbi:copper chaperone PCu(A)C [Novosphingobium malaysiense]|uniref:copper chaperone PCu(A)C n=1 Tax=Novosphingobium malaysiense TaxID=1348853 RepID=UPI000AF38D19|nr:copper chaperone PCu(A)C [Novosphingobium malaysiense]